MTQHANTGQRQNVLPLFVIYTMLVLTQHTESCKDCFAIFRRKVALALASILPLVQQLQLWQLWQPSRLM